METYRETLEKLDGYIEKNKVHNSMLSIIIFKFLFWIKITLAKKDGYIDYMSKGKDTTKMIDIISVLNDIVIDISDQMEINLTKEQFIKFKELENVLLLIFENLDNPIRSNSFIIYDENEDEKSINPLINCNMLSKLEELISIDNYL